MTLRGCVPSSTLVLTQGGLIFFVFKLLRLSGVGNYSNRIGKQIRITAP
jgi:hypothetical protein